MNATRMPAVFIGHGSPMNAIQTNDWTAVWRTLGRELPRPRAIVSVSAHWYTRGTGVTVAEWPETIHDFGGFPRELFAVRYDAPGSPAIARRLIELLAPVPVRASDDWGLDHGTWSVLVHMYPDADVPVVQLSIDATQPPEFHYALGERLAPLREEGILLLGSGGIVHNLARVDWSGASAPPEWAADFDRRVIEAVLAGNDTSLVDYPRVADSARLSVPTPEHYLPLLYVLGSRRPGEAARITPTGFDLATISMTGVVVDGS
jgi:4,5-DOPA dioxygenase extradiol